MVTQRNNYSAIVVILETRLSSSHTQVELVKDSMFPIESAIFEGKISEACCKITSKLDSSCSNGVFFNAQPFVAAKHNDKQ